MAMVFLGKTMSFVNATRVNGESESNDIMTCAWSAGAFKTDESPSFFYWLHTFCSLEGVYCIFIFLRLFFFVCLVTQTGHRCF